MRWGFLFISLFSTALWGQNYGGLSIDNDLFFGKDYYYSSGIFLQYGITKSNRDKPLDSQELFKEENYFKKVYTFFQIKISLRCQEKKKRKGFNN